MKKIIEKVKSLFCKKKPEPWYKKILIKAAFVLDMKRRYKILSFFALLFVVVYFCMPSMETIIKKVVHKYGSEITGTDVSLGGFDIKLTSGEGHVKGVKIGNPKGYKSKNLFYLKEIGVKVNIGSLTDDTIIIDSIDINNPVITYEMVSLTHNNVVDILNNIKANTAKTQKHEAKAEKKQSDKPAKAAKKIIIKSISVRNGEIDVMAGIGSHKKAMRIPLPHIQMHNVGQEKNGASVAETISTVMTKILHTASETVVSSNLKELGNASLQELKDVSGGLKNEGKAAAESAKKAAKSLGGLFK